MLLDGLDEMFLGMSEDEVDQLDQHLRSTTVNQGDVPTRTKELVWGILNGIIFRNASVIATSRPLTAGQVMGHLVKKKEKSQKPNNKVELLQDDNGT